MKKQGVLFDVAVALSSARGLASLGPRWPANSSGKLLPRSYNLGRSSGYVAAGRLDALRERLSERDWAVLRDVARLRFVTGKQLERLHFAELGETSRPVVRRRVLGRLVRFGVLGTLERRIGGVRAGSAGLVYALDIAGKRLVTSDQRARRPGLPGGRYVRHVLAVSEVYVSLAERARSGVFGLDSFKAEPASWWPDGRGGLLKPDAYAVVAAAAHSDYWWLEVDLATEHLPTLRRKLMVYRDFWRRAGRGPNGVMPRVLVSVPDAKRYAEVSRLICQMPGQEEGLFLVALHVDIADIIVQCLNQEN